MFILITSAYAQQYIIDFDGDKRQGRKGRVQYVVDLVDSTEMFANDSLVNKVYHKKTYKTAGRMENLKTTIDGKDIAHKYIVDYFTVKTDTSEINLFSKGTEIVFRINDQNGTMYEIENRALTGEEIAKYWQFEIRICQLKMSFTAQRSP